MKLEPNMYVRTKYNGIGKIVEYINDPTHYFFKCYKLDINCINCEEYITEADVIKEPSYNIIDLLEVGDFIDGKQVVNAIHCKDGFNRIELFGGKAIMNKTPIKSIVTKEQFESMEYRLGGKE